MKINHESVKLLRKLIPVFCGICFVLSLNHIFSFFQLQGMFYGVGQFGYNIWSLLGLITAMWFSNRMLQRADRRLHCISAACGILMAAAVVYGTYAHFENDIFQSIQVIFLQIVVMAGIAMVTIPVSEEILLQFDRLNQYGKQKCNGKITKRYFFIVWLLIFLAYLPIFLWWWPGNFVYDYPFQMAEVVENQYLTHHPLMHTLLMGAFYKLGLSLGDVSTGMQFYTLLQMLILSAAFAHCAYYLYKRGVPRAYRIGVILFYALFPMHAMFSITATKDVLFAAFFLWFILFIIRLLLDKEKLHWYTYGGFILSGVLCCLMRNNALYAIAAGAVIILLLIKRKPKQKLYAAGLLLCICLLSSLANTGLIAATNAKTEDRYRETFCMALQCLARVASYRYNDISEADYKEICAYMPVEDIHNYNPYLADMVKSNANDELIKKNFWNFAKLYIKLGLKFPDEYMEAWITNTMGYWYPLDRGQYASGAIEFYHKLIWLGPEVVKREYCSWPELIYKPLYQDLNVPVIGFLHRPDFWIWFLTYFLFWSIYRKRKTAGLTGVIPLMYLGTCYLGPIAILRYIYCLVVITPLIGYAVIQSTEEAIERSAE